MSEKIIETSELEKVFDAENYTLKLEGEFGITELLEMAEFLKMQKIKNHKFKFSIGDMVRGHVDGTGKKTNGFICGMEIKIDPEGQIDSIYYVHFAGKPLQTKKEWMLEKC